MSKLFTGLSAFPLTPADADGVVDTAGLGVLVERLVTAGVDSIGLLGSTGIYAYLDRHQRERAVASAVEAASGRVPLIVGVGALRTSWAIDLARDAERAGASGLLLAPVSYAALTDGEGAAHYRAVASATALPLCVYNNPGTTNFTFTAALIAELAAVKGISAIKMPVSRLNGAFQRGPAGIEGSYRPQSARKPPYRFPAKSGHGGDGSLRHGVDRAVSTFYRS